MGGEKEFPEVIIRRIQSLLTEDEATRTTILSKSWHRAWFTNPNLDLDDSQFEYGFCEYAKSTIKRYEQSNLKIESFKLHMEENCCGDKANKFVVKALTKLGATRLFLQLNGVFVLPCEAVFGGENLVELSVKGCKIYLDKLVKKYCRLESLSLDGVDIRGDALSNIISSCPLIEKLSLFNNNYEYGERRGLINTTNLDRLRCLVLCYESFEAFFPGDSLSKFPFLKDFTLLNLKRSCLEREGGLVVQISNCSLEHIRIELEKKEKSRWSDDFGLSGGWRRSDNFSLKLRLDVPSIRKFTFVGGDVNPELCFVSSSSTTREWESHVSFAHYFVTTSSSASEWEAHVSFAKNHCLSFCWFSELNNFLTQLSQSKIHLSLDVQSYAPCLDYRVGDLSFTHKHELESLTMDLTGLPSFSCYGLLDGLFRLCRPKLITHQIRKREEEDWDVCERKENIDFLWDAFEQGRHVSIPRQLMYGLKDLEEVNAQVYDVMGWRPLLLEEQDHVQQQKGLRLLLKWK